MYTLIHGVSEFCSLISVCPVSHVSIALLLVSTKAQASVFCKFL